MMQGPTLYLSGVDRAEHVRLLAREGAAGMISAAAARSPGLLNALVEFPGVPVVLDSGWSKSCSFQTYADLLEYLDTSYPGRCGWFASYDVAGDQQASDACYRELTRRFPRLRADILWIFQCAWGNRSERQRQVERLEKACRTTWRPVGLGALVPILRRSTRDALLLLQELGEVLGSLSLPTHVFGISSPAVLYWLRSQPWVESVDSSKWLVGWKAREVVLLDGTQRKADSLSLPLSAQECAAINLRVMQGWLDPLAAPHMGLWVAQSEEEQAPSAERLTGRVSREALLRWFLYHTRRNVQVRGACDAAAAPGSPSVYAPLFTIEGREYGLLSWSAGTPITPASEWCVVWEVLPDDPPVRREQLLLMDNQLTSGLFSHDEIRAPSLCHYQLPVAIAVARAMAPIS